MSESSLIADTCINLCVGKEYVLSRKIGEGSFGEIYLARSKLSQKYVAVKLVIKN